MFGTPLSKRELRRHANHPRQRRSSSATHHSAFYSQPQSTGASSSAHHRGSGGLTVNGYDGGLPYSVSDYGSGFPASDYGDELLASDYDDTTSTHHLSVLSRAHEATYSSGYTPDHMSRFHAFLPDNTQRSQPPLSEILDDELPYMAYGSNDAAWPSTEHATGDVTDSQLSLLSMGVHLSYQSDSSQLSPTTSSFHEPALPPAFPAPFGTDDLLSELDPPRQFPPSGQFDHSLQFDHSGLTDSSGLLDHSQPETTQTELAQGPSIPDITRTIAHDDANEPPWNSQWHVSRSPDGASQQLQPPSPGYYLGPPPLQTGVSDATASAPSTVPSSRGSQRDGSPQLIWCVNCEQAFSSQRSYLRHLSTATAHQDEEPRVYICKCGMTATRKDNFRKRHFENCNKPHLPSDVFSCICGCRDATVSGMERHFTHCPGQRRRGRPSGGTA